MSESSRFVRSLLKWYRLHHRKLPWRVAHGDSRNASPDPYHVLLSEMMLQQTRVATVIPYFLRFLARYPTLQALARSREQDVLRLWQGLGYYSRARNLRSCAREIVERFDGVVPAGVDDLLTLPGIGRYTAGAISSIAFNRRVPVLDGNVERVLCRIDAIRGNPKLPRMNARLWKRAESLVPLRHAGDFNSAMMELGATVCTPRNPRCDDCPVSTFCQARQRNLVHLIPETQKRASVPIATREVLIIRRTDSDRASPKFLIEQRPSRGRWASMWQFITVPADPSTRRAPQSAIQVPLPAASVVHRADLATLRHELTHRRYIFTVRLFDAVAPAEASGSRRWVTLRQLSRFPTPLPHVRIAELLQASSTA